jgi:hypothetical protein
MAQRAARRTQVSALQSYGWRYFYLLQETSRPNFTEMVNRANDRTRKLISLASNSCEASSLFEELHESMLLNIESRIRAIGGGYTGQGAVLDLPFASDVRSRSNRRAIGSHEVLRKVSE